MWKNQPLLLLLCSFAITNGNQDCVVETQKCNFPFSSPGGGQLHYSCQPTNKSSSKHFCRSQVGEEGQERHTYGLCNGGCYDLDGVTPMIFEEDDFMAKMCSTAASPCKFPFIWQGKEYMSCTSNGVEQFSWCALEVDDKGVLVEDRWGKCNMDTCAEEVKERVVAEEATEAIAEFKDTILGVVMINQQSPDLPIIIRGKVEGLNEGHFRLRVRDRECSDISDGDDDSGLLLEEVIGSDGNSSSYISSEEWQLTMYQGYSSRRKNVVGGSLIVIEDCANGDSDCENTKVSCANIVPKVSRAFWENTTYLIIILVAAFVLLILLITVLICCCCCCCRRNKKDKTEEKGSIDDIFLNRHSKSPMFDELSLPFIDASLPPTPKTGRSQNALEILLGRKMGSDTSLSEDLEPTTDLNTVPLSFLEATRIKKLPNCAIIQSFEGIDDD